MNQADALYLRLNTKLTPQPAPKDIQLGGILGLILKLQALCMLSVRLEDKVSTFHWENLIISAPKNYGEVIHLFSKGLDGFCGIWRVFVSPQSKTRYSGHTLSRLAEIRHNMTKQSRFPTTRGKSPKTRSQFKSTLYLLQPVKQFVATSCVT